MPKQRPTLAQRRRVGHRLYREYCAGATWEEMRRWYGCHGLTEPLLWALMIGAMRPGERCAMLPRPKE